MARRFDAFALFAEMRTGSNHLEASLNTLPDVTSHGEVFNPTFIGTHTQFKLFGYDMDRREADPEGFLDTIIARTNGIAGLRLFHDHDARAVTRVLRDPRIAKVILTRNPLESYVSRKIAATTGQWRLNDLKHHRDARIRFDEAEFRDMMDRHLDFGAEVERGLQITGQTAFRIRYADINDTAVLNGLADFIGSAHRVSAPAGKLKKQNPGALEDKVENPEEMAAALSRLDPFEIARTSSFEPSRRAMVPGYTAHPQAGLLFMPVTGAPVGEVTAWMARIGQVGHDGLLTGMSQKDLRIWMRTNPGFRSFSVLRHPLARAHEMFLRLVLPTDRPRYAAIRRALRNRYKLAIPAEWPDPDYGTAAHKAAFEGFLRFLKGNLAGQTSLRIDPAWATQTAILQGVAGVALPHRLVFEDDMLDDLPRLAAESGSVDLPIPRVDPGLVADGLSLKDIYDCGIEEATIDAYRRDYLTFGFPRWNRR